jgi:hypothetical protein
VNVGEGRSTIARNFRPRKKKKEEKNRVEEKGEVEKDELFFL